MKEYRLITLSLPITPDMARDLPPRVLSFIRAREGTETTVSTLFAEIRDILGLPEEGANIRAFPAGEDGDGAITLTLGGRAWCLCRYHHSGRIILPTA